MAILSHNSYDLIPPMRETWQNWIGLTYDNYLASNTKTYSKERGLELQSPLGTPG